MIPLPLAWTLLIVSMWTPGSSQVLQQEAPSVLYPKILSSESIVCDCDDIPCDAVYWFRITSGHTTLQFIGRYNNANRAIYGQNVDEKHFKFTRRNLGSFTLRIISVTEEDAGIYSCVLKNGKTEIWKPGIVLQPGVNPPTAAPPTLPPKHKRPISSDCRCPKGTAKGGCGALILWPSVGLIAAIALVLICTLYYFSRLPKKCRHHFVKKRQMT